MFTNRETYIAWRAEWRAQYKNLSAQIRTKKVELKTAFQANNYDAAYKLQRQIPMLRDMATSMLETRKESKELAAAQYLAAKAAKTEASA
jgi:hypothetical protein